MAMLVPAEWVEERLDAPGFLVIDPRRPMKYLQGHLKNAVNLPLFRAFDAEAKLLSDGDLARWIGAVGLDAHVTPIIYDSADGQNAAMLAWILEYLGRTDVHLLNIFYQRWTAEGRAVFYKPVPSVAKQFTASVKPEVRTTLEEVRTDTGLKLIDFRSRDEYTGEVDHDGRPGHLPHAVHIGWKDVVGDAQEVVAAKEKVEHLLRAAGISHGDKIVAYCRTGPRAAVGYLTLRHYGYDVRLYDGSYAEWARSGLPVEQ